MIQAGIFSVLYICSILELVRTHFAACGGEEIRPRNESENAAEPHR